MDALDLLRGSRIAGPVVRFFFFPNVASSTFSRQQVMKSDAFQMLVPSHAC